MTRGKTPPPDLAELRRRAEERLRESDVAQLSEPDLRKLLHELQVHQIELEMQGEELRAARTQAEAGLARYTELFDFAPIGYATLNADQTICELNHAAARLLGRKRAHLVGQSFGALLRSDDHQKLSALIGKAREAEGSRACELTYQKGGAPQLRLRLTASPLSREEPMILLALEDVTELRDAERRKDEFIAVLSHELRNPLAPLRNSLYVLARATPGDEQALRAQAVIDRQLSHMTRLVDDLLDVTRIKRGKIQLHRERVELGDLARRAMEDQRLSFEASGLRLEGSFEPGPFWIHGDPDRLTQVLANLLNNAEKFTPRGGAVAIRLAREGGWVRLTVRDSGVGISPEVVEHMFEPFAQAPQSIERARGGLGLGLAMVKGLVELHGGTVVIASGEQGRGTEVTLSLPLLPDAAEAVPREQDPPTPPRPRRVLIIEDNRDAADSLSEALAFGGHEVEVAYDGPTGLDRARDFRPEIALCDIGLPGMDGYAVARAFRADRALREVYLVALTGYAMPDDIERTRSAGFDRHVTKPPSLDQLERLVADAPVGRAESSTPVPRHGLH